MGIFNKLWKRLFRFFGKKNWKLGIYGAPNAGKTTLANRISLDWSDLAMGITSEVPHETKEVKNKEITIEQGSKKVTINIYDTPGIATEIDFYHFVEKYGLDEEEGKRRAKEGTRGVIEAIRWLDEMDGVILVMDATVDPFNQVNITLLGNCRVRNLPVIIVANKIDLKNASVKKIQKGFDEDPVIPVSALKGQNMDKLYKMILKKFG